MNAQVKIVYRISDEEWDRTARLRWDEEAFPLYHCFFGLVSFRAQDEEVLGTDHFDMSIADLAVGLAELLSELHSGADGVLRFQQSDDMLEILFHIDGERVGITHNLKTGRSWDCRRSDLATAITDFVGAFANEATTKVPSLLDWRDMGVLGDFITRQTSPPS